MTYGKFLFLILVCLIFCNKVYSQEEKDKADSTKVYKDIEDYSKKSGFTRFMHKLLFKPVGHVKKHRKLRSPVSQIIFKNYEGKIVRNINVTTLDPFGYSLADTTEKTLEGFYRTGNKLHIKSQDITIQNLILLRQGEPFDSIKAIESERLIRGQKYIQDAILYAKLPAPKSDSVDVYIRSHDLWSIIPGGYFSPSRFKISLSDKNFLGLGHEIKSEFYRNYTNGINTYITNYGIPNFRNTYINSMIHVERDDERNYINSLNIERRFYSSLTNWAGGIFLSQQLRNNSKLPNDSINIRHDFKSNTRDVWCGYSIPYNGPFIRQSRSTRMIYTLRYLNINYPSKPAVGIDSINLYSNESFILAGIGISRRNYTRDTYIFNYGNIEDVPTGLAYGITMGYQSLSYTSRTYFGFRIGAGRYYNSGFLSINAEIGSFIRSSQTEQGVFRLSLNYFTPLLEMGKWKLRQFIVPQLTIGFSNLRPDYVTLNNENGIPGFNSKTLLGTKKFLVSFQTQLYSPWNWIGFRFGPFLSCTLGMIGDEINGFNKSKLYSRIGAGFLIKNDFLVFNTFQISFSYYPDIPGSGENVLKINPLSTSGFGFQNFELGKPVPISLQ